jgi:hypothetical protein
LLIIQTSIVSHGFMYSGLAISVQPRLFFSLIHHCTIQFYSHSFIQGSETTGICQHHQSLQESIVSHGIKYYLGPAVCVDHTLLYVYYNICTLQFFSYLIYKEFSHNCQHHHSCLSMPTHQYEIIPWPVSCFYKKSPSPLFSPKNIQLLECRHGTSVPPCNRIWVVW